MSRRFAVITFSILLLIVIACFIFPNIPGKINFENINAADTAWMLTATALVLIMTPALEGLKREWREAAENLGASYTQYWLRVALPVLLPSILGSMILLFGNSFGAYATAYALTGGRLGIITIQIGAQIRGDVLHNPGLGYTMAMGMVLIMATSLIGYSWLQKRSERWLR